MNRRRFLQALFAVPCLGAPLLVPTVVFEPMAYRSGDWWVVPGAFEQWHWDPDYVAAKRRHIQPYLDDPAFPALLGEGG